MNTLTRENLESMTKDELINLILNLNEVKEQKSHRKYEVLEILKSKSPISILDISNLMNTSTKNVSSLLTYLRRDGVKIYTDDGGRKFLA
jgi:predicted ArsR family transcriptional regulator